MKPQSANEPEWRHYQAKDAKRKEWRKVCETCGVEYWSRAGKSKALSQRNCASCSRKTPVKENTRAKISKTLRDKYKSDPAFVEKVIKARNVKSGSEHWNWKGGVTPLNQRTRTSEEYNSWRLAVFKRDNFCCRICHSKGTLQAHHINSWTEFPEDRFILENGLTLCKECHDQYHKYEKEVRNNCS